MFQNTPLLLQQRSVCAGSASDYGRRVEKVSVPAPHQRAFADEARHRSSLYKPTDRGDLAPGRVDQPTPPLSISRMRRSPPPSSPGNAPGPMVDPAGGVFQVRERRAGAADWRMAMARTRPGDKPPLAGAVSMALRVVAPLSLMANLVETIASPDD
jgi:hypothetical protein